MFEINQTCTNITDLLQLGTAKIKRNERCTNIYNSHTDV